MIQRREETDTTSYERDSSESLSAYRQRLRRFVDQYAQLPVDTQATCPTCREVVPAVYERHGRQIVLSFQCTRCRPNGDGPLRVVHHDAIWTDLQSDFPGSAETTLHGARIRPVHRRLPRTIETLCPECSCIVLGRYFVMDSEVWIEKTCPEHGYVRDKISSDVLLFSKAAWWSYEEHPGQKYPQVSTREACPSDCGLCSQHISSPVLAQIDLTNRCNMRCPICFANANAQGFVFEPDFDEIVRELRVLRDLRPTPTTAIQFTGGEPTLHPDFLRIVSTARDMGFSHIQIATNGLTLADEDFAHAAAEAGLHTVYLQFDGVGEAPYRRTRAFPGIWEKKLAAVENCRKADMKICLVPTLLKGVNDDQIPSIFQFAVDHIDTISGISWQPVSFTGRISEDDRASQRYTLGDLAEDLGTLPGVEPLRDIFPLSLVLPLSQILEALTGQPKIRPSCHPTCALGTYFLVSSEGKAYPFPAVIDVEGMFWEMNRHAARIRRKGQANWLDKLRLYWMLKRHWNADTAPPGLTVGRFIRTLMGMVDKRVGRGKAGQKTYRSLLCAGMHFQDRYNYDVERTKRCVILYSTPSGVFPFCSHNCGPEYRHWTQQAEASQYKRTLNCPDQTSHPAEELT